MMNSGKNGYLRIKKNHTQTPNILPIGLNDLENHLPEPVWP